MERNTGLKEDVKCKHCQQPFKRPKQGRKKEYCSDKCQRIYTYNPVKRRLKYLSTHPLHAM